MEALNIRLDQTESVDLVRESVHGTNRAFQGESSFSSMLEQVLEKGTDGIQNTQAKQEAPSEDSTSQILAAGNSAKDDTEFAAESIKDPVSEISESVAAVENAEETIESVSVDEFNLSRLLLDTDAAKAETEEPAVEPLITDFAVKTVLNVEEQEEAEVVFDSGKIEKTAGKKKSSPAEDNIESMFVFLEKDKNTVSTDAAVALENTTVQDIKAKTKVTKTGEKNVIRVVDERSEEVADKVEKGNFVTSVKFDSANSAEVSLSLSDSSGFETPANPVAEKTSDSVFSSMLSHELQTNAGELVKTGLITLKDNNTGSIKLILHPEQLGNVKIKLDLSEKVITGKIIVSSEEAFTAFKNSLESLRQAFISSGFENAGLELSLAGNGSSDHNPQNQDRNPKGLIYSESLPVVAVGSDGSYVNYYDSTSINVVA